MTTLTIGAVAKRRYAATQWVFVPNDELTGYSHLVSSQKSSIKGNCRINRRNVQSNSKQKRQLPEEPPFAGGQPWNIVFCSYSYPDGAHFARIGQRSNPAAVRTLAAGVQVYEWPTQLKHPRGIVLAVHGTTQQAGCFESLSHFLNDAGFNVVAMDLRGHGRSYFKTNIDNPRHEISYSRSAEDLARVAQHLKVVYPRIPIFCLGESVGAGVTVRAAADHPDLFEGIILASAGTTPHFFNMQMVAPDLVKGLSDLDRPLDVSDYITKYSSEDPRITHEMVNDPLSRTMLTGKEILQTAAFIHKTPHNAKQLAPNISVLLINGADDAIVRAESTQEIMKNIPSRDKKMVVVPNCGHLLLGTAYLKKSVVTPLTEWLIYQTDSSQTATAGAKPIN